jgi:glutathione S-transferase
MSAAVVPVVARGPSEGDGMSPCLYGCSNSGHTYKVRLFLLLAGIEHEYRFVSLKPAKPDRLPDFVGASAYGEVPVLRHAGRHWCQSNAILIELARHHRCFAGGDGEWPRLLEWLFWEADRVGASVSNLRFARKYAPRPQPVMDYLESLARNDLAVLEQALDEHAFLLPCGFSIADISCAGYLYWLSDIGVSDEEYPAIRRWLSAISRLPRWAHPYQVLGP